MKKIFLLLCFLGIALQYYNLYKYLEQKNWEWSLTEFFVEANSIDGALDSYEAAVNTGPLNAANGM